MSKWIQALDCIGVQPEVTYKGETRYKTLIGGMVSMILYILLLSGLIYFGSEIYERNNPTIITGYTYNPAPPRINISATTFPVSVGVQDPTNNLNYYKDPTIFTLKAFQKFQNRTKTDTGESKIISSKRELKLVDCDPVKHFIGLEKEFANIDEKSTYCVDTSEDTNIQGHFDNDIFNSLIFYIYQCNNATSNNSCKSQAVIDKKLKSSYMDIQYHYYFYNPKSYSTPMIRSKQSYYTSISNYGKKTITMYLKKINYITDAGILTRDTDTQTYNQLDYMRELLNNVVPLPGDSIASFTMRLSFTEETNERSYMKIQTLLANIGGLYKILTLIATGIPQLFFSNYFYFNIINENFQVEEEKQTTKIMQYNTIMRSKFNRGFNPNYERSQSNNNEVLSKVNLIVSKSNYDNMIPCPNEKVDQLKHQKSISLQNLSKELVEQYKIKLMKLKMGNRIKISFSQYIKIFCCSCLGGKKNLHFKDMLIRGRDKIKQAMDMNSIVKRGFEIEKIKSILLTKEQKVLFDAFPRTNLESVVNKEDKSVPNKYEILELINAYNEVRSVQNDMNDRFIGIFNKDVFTKMDECIKKSKLAN